MGRCWLLVLGLLGGCSTAELKETVFGFQEKNYVEPVGPNVATLVVEAPKLSKKMWVVEDKITVSFFDSCVEKNEPRRNGYVGGFQLSSNAKIGKSKSVKIPVQAPLFVEVGYAIDSAQCTNKFRLTPEQGERYKIVWEYNFGVCSASGLRITESGKLEPSSQIQQRNNKSGFLAGGSGRTTTEWRECGES